MKPGPLKIDARTFAQFAADHVPLHATFTALGMHLVVTNPQLHANARGQVTARFVYRGQRDTVVFVAKRLQVEWA